jgi:hypothetical protein
MRDCDRDPYDDHEFMQEWYKINGGSEHVLVMEDGQEPCYTSGGE